MPIIVRESIEITDVETQMIEPQVTIKTKKRIFTISNGDNEIEVIAYGSNDGKSWEERDSKTIEATITDSLIVGPNVSIVKLIGRTTTPGSISIVDTSLTY